jgi:membrane protein DedA with SNARE-associated domain
LSEAPSHTPPSVSDEEVGQGLSLEPEERKRVRLCLLVIGILTTVSLIGTAFSPYLATHYPRLLISISPNSRHMVLVAPVVGLGALLTFGLVRRMLFTFVAYWLGRSIGEPGLVWLEQRAQKSARFVRWLERFFKDWSYLAVIAFPHGAMASIAGVAKMRPVGFFPCALLGITIRLVLLYMLASQIRGPIMMVLEFIRAYQLPVTAAAIVAVPAYQYWKRRAQIRAS